MSESAAALAMSLPVATSPVSDTSATRRSVTSDAPAVSPWPHTTLNTPGGKRSSVHSASFRALSGVSSDGLSTTVLPAASAGPTFQAAIMNG